MTLQEPSKGPLETAVAGDIIKPIIVNTAKPGQLRIASVPYVISQIYRPI